MSYTIREIKNETELEKIQQIRVQVFVKEQGIPLHLERDGKDSISKHIGVFSQEAELLGCGRLSPGDTNDLGIISRITVHPGHRGKGLGKKIVKGLEDIARSLGLNRLQLKPHVHLHDFYENLGYVQLAKVEETAGEHPLLLMEKKLPE